MYDKKVTKFVTTHVFDSFSQEECDNHPLRKWENQLLPENNLQKTSTKFDDMATPFLAAHSILSTQILGPEDWNGSPMTEGHAEVMFKIQMALEAQSQSWPINTFNLGYWYGARTDSFDNHYLLGTVPWKQPHNYKTLKDSSKDWEDSPIQTSPDSDYIKFFHNPLKSPHDIVAFNHWNPCIVFLCQARIHILHGIKNIVTYLLQPKLKDLIDLYKDDLKHYFYHHCHIFRLMDGKKDPLEQGFTCQCLHYVYEKKFSIVPTPLRQLFRPCNPMLSAEEDEFLHHASRIFADLGQVNLTNAIC
jgi:hypothetical protein